MNRIIVKKIGVTDVKAVDVVRLLDREKVEFNSISCVNWEKDFPYAPEVAFRMVYTDKAILLHYKVKEESVRAVAAHDNGPVWEDACVEFFSIPANDGIYYNVECNCAGTLLIGAGKERHNREHAPQDILDKIERWSSLGSGVFDERLGECCWEVALIIPYTSFFKHQLTSLQGETIRCNFYKCGDKLKTPHFLSWNKIDVLKPDFHQPAYFGEVTFR